MKKIFLYVLAPFSVIVVLVSLYLYLFFMHAENITSFAESVSKKETVDEVYALSKDLWFVDIVELDSEPYRETFILARLKVRSSIFSEGARCSIYRSGKFLTGGYSCYHGDPLWLITDD